MLFGHAVGRAQTELQASEQPVEELSAVRCSSLYAKPANPLLSCAAERLSSMNSQMSGRLYDRQVSREALLGPKRPRPHKIWKKKFIKVLVVGDSGLGKTTLVKTLLSTPGERLQVRGALLTAKHG